MRRIRLGSGNSFLALLVVLTGMVVIGPHRVAISAQTSFTSHPSGEATENSPASPYKPQPPVEPGHVLLSSASLSRWASSESQTIRIRGRKPIREHLSSATTVPPLTKASATSNQCIVCDVTGDDEVNILDIIVGMRMALNVEPPPESLFCVDKNLDGVLNILDVIDCLRKAMGIISESLRAKNVNGYPTRITRGSEGNFYVTDAKVGSVFIYDADFQLIGELKNLDRPLGVAVDPQGRIYVGSNGGDSVEVYSDVGAKLMVIDQGNIQMPNDLALDRQGNLYVADSRSHTVKVYAVSGQWLRDIGAPGDGEGELRFPSALTIAYRTGAEAGELYVADQGHAKVQVFDLQGNFLRSYGGFVSTFFSSSWEGKFVKIQSLAMDEQGRLHAADSYMNKVQILDPDTGDYINSYGSFGADAGKLNLPLDILITSGGQVVVTNAGNHRVEIMDTTQ